LVTRPSCLADRLDKWAPHTQSLATTPSYSSYKYHGVPPDKKCEESEVLWAGGLLGMSGVLGVARVRKLYQNLFGFDGVF
jgi:hypothetical protein